MGTGGTPVRKGLLLAVVLAFAALAFGLVARDRVGDSWRDARAALNGGNPLCGPLAAFKGLRKARAVSRRTEEIRKAGEFFGEDGGLFLYRTPSGEVWMPQANDLGSLAVVLAEQEQEMYGAAGGLGVHAGDVVIDAGAHVGLFTRTALAAGARTVVTFEVTPNSNRALRRNLAREIGAGTVVVVEKGVLDKDGSLPLVIVENCSVCNSVSHPWMRATLDVPLTTIDHAVAELGLPRVDFIKLDIENAEANALRGAHDTLARFHPRLAVALENSKTRIQYAHEVLGIVQEAFAGYTYECGAVTPDDEAQRILPEVLHFHVD
jgi:FkbM family methyltransferase